MIHLPKGFTLRRRRWKVVLADDLGEDRSPVSGKVNKTIGECDGESCTISILEGMSDLRTCQTLAHEFIHALEFSFDIRVPHRLVYSLDKHLGRMILRLIRAQEGRA